MSDREKAFVLNGLRNYGRAFNAFAGIDPDDADRRLSIAAKAMSITADLLEQTRLEQQQLVEEIIKLAGGNWVHGN